MSSARKVLIVEDEVKIAELLADYFVQAGYEPQLLHRGGAVVDPGPLGERLEHAQHGALETGHRA